MGKHSDTSGRMGNPDQGNGKHREQTQTNTSNSDGFAAGDQTGRRQGAGERGESSR